MKIFDFFRSTNASMLFDIWIEIWEINNFGCWLEYNMIDSYWHFWMKSKLFDNVRFTILVFKFRNVVYKLQDWIHGETIC